MVITRCLHAVCPALLALLVFGLPTAAVAGSIVTSTRTNLFIPGGHDADSFINADAESYAEFLYEGSTFTGSALAQLNGNLEVGVTLAPRLYFPGQAQANANLTITQHYEAGDSRIAGVSFTVEPGEILFTTELGAPFEGEFNGFLQIRLNASINDVVVDKYFFRLEVASTNGGIDINSGSTGTALAHLSEVYSGGLWGVKTSGFTDVLVITPAIFPGDVLTISYDMQAEVLLQPLDARFTYSAKLGDPLELIGNGGGIVVLPSVPEPPSSWLMGLALGVIGLRLSNRSARRRGRGFTGVAARPRG